MAVAAPARRSARGRAARASPWRSPSSPWRSSGQPSWHRTSRATSTRRVRAAAPRAPRPRRRRRPAARHAAPGARRRRGRGAQRALPRQGPRPGLLHRVRPAVQADRRLALPGDRHRDAARRDRPLERGPRHRRRGRARRRAPRPPGPGAAARDAGRRRAPRLGAPGGGGARRRLAGPPRPRRAGRLLSAAALAVDEVRAVQAGLADRAALAASSPTTPSAPRPAAGCSTGLRGKDVLLVFIESYGRVAVQDSSFSPGIDAVLGRGTRSCGPPASPRAAPSSPRRPSAASAGWRTPPCRRGSGSTASAATTSSWRTTASR